MSNAARKRDYMATFAAPPKVGPKDRIAILRQRSASVDTSVRGSALDRAAHQIQTLEDWRPIRNKATK
jgi:hypothetical protein